jgi:hypothetical protein
MEIFIARAEQGLDVGGEFNIFFHSGLWRRLQQPDWAHCLILVTGMWLAAGFGRAGAGVFFTRETGYGNRVSGIAHPDYGAVTNHLRSA